MEKLPKKVQGIAGSRTEREAVFAIGSRATGARLSRTF